MDWVEHRYNKLIDFFHSRCAVFQWDSKVTLRDPDFLTVEIEAWDRSNIDRNFATYTISCSEPVKIRSSSQGAPDVAQKILHAFIENIPSEIKSLEAPRSFTLGIQGYRPATAEEPIALLTKSFERLGIALTEARNRAASTELLSIENERDLQTIFHFLLRTSFDDVRAEDPAPAIAGAGSRIDFFVPALSLGIELKYVHPSYSAKLIGEQIIVDKKRYQSHADTKNLIFFVFDPRKIIQNPLGLISDLEKDWHRGKCFVRIVS